MMTRTHASLTLASLLAASACGGVEDDAPEPVAETDGAIGGGCSYTVRGELAVDHQLQELEDAYGTSPLANVLVKVSGKEKVLGVWGWYASWGEVRTDSSGEFELTVSKSCNAHRFKVEVKFQDSELEVRHEHSTSSLTQAKWYLIHELANGEWKGGTKDVGTKTFAAGGAQELGDDEPRAHADIWVLYKDAIDYIDGLGSSTDFNGLVAVKYPHNSLLVADDIESSYANPLTNDIYIQEDHFNADTLLHELMHVWAYQHSTGEDGMAVELLQNGGTHGLVDESFVAFHEGFAEYAKDELLAGIYGLDPVLPFSREEHFDDGLVTLSLLERHDDGWLSIFRTLTLPKIWDYDFLEGNSSPGSKYVVEDTSLLSQSTCESPEADLHDVLLSFESSSSAGHASVIDDSEMNVADYLDRFEDIVSGFGETDEDRYKSYIDPADDTQPHDDYCEVNLQTVDPGAFVRW